MIIDKIDKIIIKKNNSDKYFIRQYEKYLFNFHGFLVTRYPILGDSIKCTDDIHEINFGNVIGFIYKEIIYIECVV